MFAPRPNAKCPSYFTREGNGLEKEWSSVCWMNPPYGREIRRWVEKTFKASQNGAIVACLLPARTDTSWWHDFCALGEIRFVRGRLKFGNPAPFPSAVVVFRPSEMRKIA
jgi:phage N-6-adenine-methyltransferase